MFVIDIIYGGNQVEAVSIKRAEKAVKIHAKMCNMTSPSLKNAYACWLKFIEWDEIDQGAIPFDVARWGNWWRQLESAAYCALNEGCGQPKSVVFSVEWES